MKRENDPLGFHFRLLVDVTGIVGRGFVGRRLHFAVHPASAAIEKRDAAFPERGLGEKARAFHVDLPVIAIRKLGLPVDGGDVEDTLDPGNCRAQTRRVRKLAFETLDIEAFEERPIARAADEGADLVAGLSEQTG